jgi:hypothetical protein
MLGFSALAKLPLASLPRDAGQTLSPDLFVDADTFYSATVSPGTVTLSPALYSDPDTFYAPFVQYATLFPDLFADADTFYSPLLTIGIAPPLFVDGDIFYPPFVGLGTPPVQFPANICQHSGFKTPPWKLARQWNGVVSRYGDYDDRHPQELVRPVRDYQGVPVPRPEQADVFLAAGDVTADDL